MHKGQCKLTFMEEIPKQKIVNALQRKADRQVNDTNARLHDIVDQMLEPHGKTSPRHRRGLSPDSELMPPFDIQRPNQHETKAQFNDELAVVSGSLKYVTELLRTMLPETADGEGIAPEIERLARVLDRKLREKASMLDASDSGNLLRKNAADVGGYGAFLYSLIDMQSVLEDRARELEDQKSLFWHLSSRAPDYYGRFLALNLARLFCREVGAFPTYGTSGETGEPSTDYCRALKQVFAALGHDVSEREHARWAVSQLTEEDIEPRQGGLLGKTFGLTPRETEEETLAALSRTARKKSPDK